MIKDVSLVTELENPPNYGEWTFADYERLTADNETRYEVIEGILYQMPPPTPLHQQLVTKLILRLGTLIESKIGGTLFASPIEVILPDIATPVQPDLVYISHDRREIIQEKRIVGSPDLVIEILSPSSIRYDRVTKFEVYETSGIQEYWIVNPKTQSLEIYTLENGLYNLFNEFSLDEPVHSPLLGELAFTVGSLVQ